MAHKDRSRSGDPLSTPGRREKIRVHTIAVPLTMLTPATTLDAFPQVQKLSLAHLGNRRARFSLRKQLAPPEKTPTSTKMDTPAHGRAPMCNALLRGVRALMPQKTYLGVAHRMRALGDGEDGKPVHAPTPEDHYNSLHKVCEGGVPVLIGTCETFQQCPRPTTSLTPTPSSTPTRTARPSCQQDKGVRLRTPGVGKRDTTATGQVGWGRESNRSAGHGKTSKRDIRPQPRQ